MKVIQITDLHLAPPGDTVAKLDPEERLVAVIAAINARYSDAAFCIVSGDLADTGDPRAYDLLRSRLEALSIPYHLMIGNHDHRANFQKAFTDVSADTNGFVQSAFSTGDNAFILLDTVCHGAPHGEFCDRRADWLAERLEEHRGRAIHLFMHHPPLSIGIPRLDLLRVLDTGPFERALATSDSVRQIFFGHVHRPAAGVWNGIPFTALPAQNHQVKLDLEGQEGIRYCHEPPMIGVILIEAGQTVMHFDNHLDGSLVPKPQAKQKS